LLDQPQTLSPFDVVQSLTSDEAITTFLADAEESGDVDLIAAAKKDAERTRGIILSKKAKDRR
jgi:DNA-binding phage protein